MSENHIGTGREAVVLQGEDLTAFPAEFDPERPSAARVYDYYLGGASNLKVDRDFGKKVLEVLPEARDYALYNRAFLRRAVRYCASRGVRQFLDIGAGIPTVGHTHEIAQQIDPACRVVYVDNEALAVAHSELLLTGNPNAAAVHADLRAPSAVLDARETRRLLNFDEPIAVLMVALLHFIPEADDPKSLLRRYHAALVPGSYLVMSHATDEDLNPRVGTAAEMYRTTDKPACVRDREQIIELFDGFDLVEPGVVLTSQWRPDSPSEVVEPNRAAALGGVGRKIF
ncbi:MAG TPA: SAM-dependent methyltransferase [Pseudonocardiaceae bacterium]|nr:SAM-dependent methyltransferase [Pseudonocardiaceae bacterium]